MIDNALSTAKTILIQRNKSLIAGICLGLSNFIYLSITKNVVTADSPIALIVVSIAGGIGCCLAVGFNNKFSKERTFVNVIMSDNLDAMKDLRDFLAEHKITNTATDCYTKDWGRKSITITAYPETKYASRLIDDYLEKSPSKFKRVIRK